MTSSYTGAAAALVFGKLFFPQSNAFVGTMAAFGAFAVGFIARPLGGIVFGHFGDRIGRRNVLVVTLGIMGLSTFLIGLLPTYNQIGVWAPIMLVVLRIAQGLALGGEWGGAALLVVEHSPSNRRGWNSAWPQLGVPAGLVLSTGVMALLSHLTADQFEIWGWRVPFLISILLVAVGTLIRMTIDETPVFSKMEQHGEIKRYPALEIIRSSKKMVLLAIGARFAENGSFFIFSVFSLSYATKHLGVPETTILGAVVVAALATMVTIPIFAGLTDKIGRKPVFMAGALFTGLFAFPFFWLLQTGQPLLMTLAIILALSIGWSAIVCAAGCLFCRILRAIGPLFGHVDRRAACSDRGGRAFPFNCDGRDCILRRRSMAYRGVADLLLNDLCDLTDTCARDQWTRFRFGKEPLLTTVS